MDQTIVTCLNCGNEYNGDFCPSCGQAAATGKFTWKSLILALLHALDFEHGILYIFRELWLRPRQLVFGYISGKRANVLSPIKFMLVSIAIITALHYLYNDEDLGLKTVMMNGVEQNINLWTTTSLSLFHLIVLPFYALITRLFFRKWNLSLPEHFVLNMFVLGQSNCVEFIVLAIFCWVPNVVLYSSVFSMVLPGYLYFMMSKPKTVGALFKSFSVGVVSLFMFMLVIILLTVLFLSLSGGGLSLVPPTP